MAEKHRFSRCGRNTRLPKKFRGSAGYFAVVQVLPVFLFFFALGETARYLYSAS